MNTIIDLDANATTRLDRRVLERMVGVLEGVWGNASSDHRLGAEAAAVVEDARESVARLIDAEPDEILFTSGATESINLAIQGIVAASAGRGHKPHLITSNIEHKAVLQTVESLYESSLVDVTVVKADRLGRVNPEDVRAALRDDTVLVCLLHGNNEIGTINPIEEVGEILQRHPALFFVDAVQTLGYSAPSVQRTSIDLMSLSAHKMHGPKGVGALYLRGGVRLFPLVHGGRQERGYRPGTLNTAGIAGFGMAAELACVEGPARAESVRRMRDDLLSRILHDIPDVAVNGHPTDRLPGNLSLTIPYVEARKLQHRLADRVAFSRGSACTSSSDEPSHVLRAIGLSEKELQWTIRLGLSSANGPEEVAYAADRLIATSQALRRPAPQPR